MSELSFSKSGLTTIELCSNSLVEVDITKFMKLFTIKNERNNYIIVDSKNQETWLNSLTDKELTELWNSKDKTVPYINKKGENKTFRMTVEDDKANAVQLYLKFSNIYCLDIDYHKFENGKVLQSLYDLMPFLKSCPFTLSRTKSLPHFYFKIEGIEEYNVEVNIINNKNIEADLLHPTKAPIELLERCLYYPSYDNRKKLSLPTFQWNDIKQYFNIETMNFRNKNKSSSSLVMKSSTEGIQSCISQGIESSKEKTNYETNYEGDKNKWFELAIICAKHNMLYKYSEWIVFAMILKNELGDNAFDLFHDISKVCDNYIGVNDEKKYKGLGDCHKYWNSIKIKKSDEKKYTFGTLIKWAKDANKDEFNKWNRKYTKCLIQDEVDEVDEKDESYEAIKTEFEKNHFKVRYPLSFYEEINNKVNYYSKKDFVDLNMNSYIYHKKNKNGEIEKLPIVNDWLKDPKIREYDEMNFIPYGPNEESTQNDKIYNTFSGYNIQKHNFTDEDLIDVQQFKDYLYAVAGESQENYEYLYRWLARIIKHPRHKTNTCILIKSPQGTGKGTLQEFMKAILGTKYAEQYCGTDILVEKFNGVLENKLFVAIDEGSSNNYNHSGKMKNRITEPTIEIEEKGIKKRIVNNLMNIMIVTNDDIVVKIEESDRRYVMLKASSKYINNTSFFGNLKDNFLHNPIGLYSVYKWFLNCDVDEKYDFQNNRPITTDYKAVQALNIPIIALFFQDLLETFNDKNKIEESKDKTYHFIRCIDLFTYFKNYCKEAGFKIEPTLSRFGLDIVNHTPFISKMKKNCGIVYSFKIEDIKNALKKYQPKCLIEDDEE